MQKVRFYKLFMKYKNIKNILPRGICCMARERSSYKLNAFFFILSLFQNRFDPTPPGFFNFCSTISNVQYFGTFEALLVSLNSPYIIYVQILLQHFGIWSTPPPFNPKFQKKLVTKKVNQNFWIALDSLHPLLKPVLKMKLDF